jgi:ribonuclease P/MRP protein subunit RPP1
MSFYECLKALPEGSDSPSRLALAARHLGYRGIIVCNSDPEKVFLLDAASRIRGIEVALGADVLASSPRALRSRVLSLRSRCPLISVRGISEEMVRAACEDPNVDVLMHAQDGKPLLGIASARAAKLNKVAIGFDLSPMIRLRGSPRSRWLDVMRRTIELARKFNLSMVITTSARSHLDLRSPRDLLALAEVVGFETSEAKEAMMLPGKLLELNRRSWAGPGVELL